jgi:hypothetical protein
MAPFFYPERVESTDLSCSLAKTRTIEKSHTTHWILCRSMPGIPELLCSTLTNRIGPLHTGHGMTTDLSSSSSRRPMISSGHVHAARRLTERLKRFELSRRKKYQCAM